MGKILCYCWCLLEDAPVTWSGYIYCNFTASVVHIPVQILAWLQYPPSLGQTWSYLCFFNHFPLIHSSLPSVSWLTMPITHIPPLHWALSIITSSEMSLSFPFFHPSLCLSTGSSNGMMGWRAYIRGLSCRSGLANLPSPPSAIQLQKHAVTGKPQPASLCKTYTHTVTLNARTKVNM